MEDSLVEEETLPHSHRVEGVVEVQSQSMYSHLLKQRALRKISKAREDGSAHEVRLERAYLAFGIA